MRRRSLGVAAALAVAGAVMAGVALTGSGPAPSSPVAPPWEFTAPAWQGALGGDGPLSPDRYRQLARATPGLDAADAAQVAALATRVAVADLTAAGRGSFPGYWPPPAATGVAPSPPCAGVKVLAASPAALPTAARADGVARYAKVLVAYQGSCSGQTFTAQSPGVAYVYAAQSSRGVWAPVRDWDIPVASSPTAQSADAPAPWQLKTFDACASPGQVLRDRIMVVDAFDLMCADARRAGVPLTVTAAYRTRAEQAAFFAAAVAHYGSEQEARRWVAYADDQTCTSRHCSGVALDVAPTTAAMGWLTAVAGCADGAHVQVATSCPPGTTPVPRMARYGFAEPVASIPGYLEFTLPVGDQGAGGTDVSAPDCAPSSVPVPNMVAAIFRCRLAREGVTGAAQAAVVAQALVVSRCESGWNAAARAFAGRFAASPNPATGKTYTQAGVFMIASGVADAGWVPGGAAQLADPVANINGAASLWLATHGFEQFGCATGRTGGFEGGPVLPAYGGPALPGWASRY